MLKLILILNLFNPLSLNYYQQEIVPQQGWSSHYSPNIMEATVYVRQGFNHIPENLDSWDGFIARPHCSEIGSTYWIRKQGSENYEKFLVTDCAVRDNSVGALSWMTVNNILVEFDYKTAERWDILWGGFGIEMLSNYEYVKLQMNKFCGYICPQ